MLRRAKQLMTDENLKLIHCGACNQEMPPGIKHQRLGLITPTHKRVEKEKETHAMVIGIPSADTWLHVTTRRVI